MSHRKTFIKNQKDVGLKAWMGVLIIFLIAILIWGIFFIQDEKNKVAILGVIAVILAAITSVLTVSINNRKAKEREYEFHILKEKQKAYEHFYNVIFRLFENVIKKRPVKADKEVISEMLEFKKGLMNWGSEKLISEFIIYEASIGNRSEETPYPVFVAGDKFLKELRKELGFKDKGEVNLMSVLLTHEGREELKNFL